MLDTVREWLTEPRFCGAGACGVRRVVVGAGHGGDVGVVVVVGAVCGVDEPVCDCDWPLVGVSGGACGVAGAARRVIVRHGARLSACL